MINIVGNASSSVALGPRTDGPYTGLLLFQSRTLTGDLSITADGTFNLSGTIYAPAARLYVTGNGAASNIGSQWIGRELYLAGNGGINITYSDAAVARHATHRDHGVEAYFTAPGNRTSFSNEQIARSTSSSR